MARQYLIAHDAQGGLLQATELPVVEQDGPCVVEAGEILAGPRQYLLAFLTLEDAILIHRYFVEGQAVERDDGLPNTIEVGGSADAHDARDGAVEGDVLVGGTGHTFLIDDTATDLQGVAIAVGIVAI